MHYDYCVWVLVNKQQSASALMAYQRRPSDHVVSFIARMRLLDNHQIPTIDWRPSKRLSWARAGKQSDEHSDIRKLDNLHLQRRSISANRSEASCCPVDYPKGH